MILAVRTADDKQVYKWERVLLTSKAAPGNGSRSAALGFVA
jgi:hypothetical protein